MRLWSLPVHVRDFRFGNAINSNGFIQFEALNITVVGSIPVYGKLIIFSVKLIHKKTQKGRRLLEFPSKLYKTKGSLRLDLYHSVVSE